MRRHRAPTRWNVPTSRSRSRELGERSDLARDDGAEAVAPNGLDPEIGARSLELGAQALHERPHRVDVRGNLLRLAPAAGSELAEREGSTRWREEGAEHLELEVTEGQREPVGDDPATREVDDGATGVGLAVAQAPRLTLLLQGPPALGLEVRRDHD